jgi:hypothetical protein
LINRWLHPLSYNIGRLHGIEQAAWLSELEIATVFGIGANVGQFAAMIRKVVPEARALRVAQFRVGSPYKGLEATTQDNPRGMR